MTPAGAVPVAVQVSVTVPVKVLIGSDDEGDCAVVPAMRVVEVEVLPFASARVKSGGEASAGEGGGRAVAEALVTTWSCPVAAPTAVGVKTTLMAQVAPMASEVPQLLLAAKAPVVVMLVMVTGSFAGVGEGEDLSSGGFTDDGAREGRRGWSEGGGQSRRGQGEVADGGVVVGGAGRGGGVVVGGERGSRRRGARRPSVRPRRRAPA